jgi:hypothetical protein
MNGPFSKRLPPRFVTALLTSQALALLWWWVALQIRLRALTNVWIDQEYVFMQAARHLANPFEVIYFANPPWTAALLAPFGLLPLELSALLQIGLYFAILTGVIYKFGGSFKTVLIVFTSFMALDSAIELNVEWLVALGLLVPAALSGPLLLVKPQIALGYGLSFNRRQLLQAGAVLQVVLAISLLVWPLWPQHMRDAAAKLAERAYNLAPMGLLPVPVSLGIGAVLAWRAFRLRDPVLSVLAWLFFVPYIAFYSLLILFALLATRYPRFMLLISVVMWIVYGGVFVLALIRS